LRTAIGRCSCADTAIADSRCTEGPANGVPTHSTAGPARAGQELFDPKELVILAVSIVGAVLGVVALAAGRITI
jgi:hypothetical protein